MPDIRTCFLIPLTQDREVGNGQLHSTTVWTHFHRLLTVTFDGWRVSSATSAGTWRDPKTGAVAKDTCREYVIAMPRKTITMLRKFLRTECVAFKQKVIYLEVGGEVEYIVLGETGKKRKPPKS
jgi:hypothetical protein